MIEQEKQPLGRQATGNVSLAEKYSTRHKNWRFPRLSFRGMALVLAAGIGSYYGGRFVLTKSLDLSSESVPITPPGIEASCEAGANDERYPNGKVNYSLTGALPDTLDEQLLEVIFKGPYENSHPIMVIWRHSGFFYGSNAPGPYVRDWYRQDKKNPYFASRDRSVTEVLVYQAKISDPIKQPEKLDPQDLVDKKPLVTQPVEVSC